VADLAPNQHKDAWPGVVTSSCAESFHQRVEARDDFGGQRVCGKLVAEPIARESRSLVRVRGLEPGEQRDLALGWGSFLGRFCGGPPGTCSVISTAPREHAVDHTRLVLPASARGSNVK